MNPPHQGPELDNDWQLMERLAQGDEHALGQIITRHEKPLLSFAYRYLGDLEEAQDTVQEAFVRAYRSADSYRPDAQLRTWLFRICTNLCLTALRRRKRNPIFVALAFWRRDSGDAESAARMDSIPAPSRDRPEDSQLKDEQAHTIRTAMDCLPHDQRTAVLLRYFEELSYQDIALALDRSVSSIESLLFRARQRLARELAESYPLMAKQPAEKSTDR